LEGEVWDNEKQKTFKRLQEKDDIDKMKRRLEDERSTSKARKEDDRGRVAGIFEMEWGVARLKGDDRADVGE
jgi:hypothetical protein